MSAFHEIFGLLPDMEMPDQQKAELEMLRAENKRLVFQMSRLTRWPSGVQEGNWRGRCLLAERKLEEALQRIRDLTGFSEIQGIDERFKTR
jgi:hypothetical protein